MIRGRGLRLVPALLALSLVASGAAGCGEKDEPSVTSGPVSTLPRAGDPGTRFGYSESIQAGSGEAEALARSGSDLVRRRLSWTEIEPTQGAFDWTTYDAIYAEALAAGVRPLWLLVDAPCWASPPVPACTPIQPARAPSVEHAADLGAFLAEAARRYPGSLGIEVGNEVNDERFWVGGLDPNDYSALLGAAADAIHAADPEMPVVASGLAPFEQARAGRLPWRDYVRAMLNYGLAERIDAFAFHPYAPGIALQRAPAVARQQVEFERYLDSKGAGDVPVWVTEIGVTTVGPQARTPAQQALELVGIHDRLTAAGVPVIAIHKLEDVVIAGDPLEAGFGVIAADGLTLKPAFCALAAARGEPCT